eukprot:gene22489-28617_t
MSGAIKLADFGASKRIESESIVSGLKGTPHWMAPEVIKGTQMSTGWIKADVWSLGCTVVELFTGRVPYAEYDNPMTAMYKIASGEIPQLKQRRTVPGGRVLSVEEMVAVDAESSPSEALLSFVRLCCAVDPEDRPSVEELLAHPFAAQTLPSEVQQSFVDLIRLSTVKEMPLNVGSSSTDHSDMFRPESHHRSAAVASSVDSTATYNNNNLNSSHINRGEHQRLRNFHQSGVSAIDLDGGDEGGDETYEDDDWHSEGEGDETGAGSHTETDDTASSVDLMPPPSRCQTQQTGQHSIGFSLERPEAVRRFSNNGRDPADIADDPNEQSFGDLPTPCMFGGQGRGMTRYASDSDLTSANQVSGDDNRTAGTKRLESISSFRVPMDLGETDGDVTMGNSSEGLELDADEVYGQAQAVYQSMLTKYMSPRGGGGGGGGSNSSGMEGVSSSDYPDETTIDTAPVEATLTAIIKPNLSPVRIGGSKRSVAATETPPKTVVQSPIGQPVVAVEKIKVSVQPLASSNKFGYTPQAAADLHSNAQSNGNRNNNRNTSHMTAPKQHLSDPVQNVNNSNNIKPAPSVSRPNAPLSGEKLRIHTGLEDLAPSGGAPSDEQRPGGGASSQMMDKLARSGAAAVRKKAASDIKDAQTKTDARRGGDKQMPSIKAKPVASQPTMPSKTASSSNKQPTKRSRTERLSHMMAAHSEPVDLASSLNHQFRPQHTQQQQGQEISARSRSAGVTLSHEGGQGLRDARHRLPPVSGLRADNSYCNNNEDSENDEGREAVGKGSTPVRYIQTAPAVSRSVNLPPIKESAAYTSQTPKLKTASRLNNISGGAAGRLLVRPSAAPLGSMHTSSSSVDLLPLHRVQEER